MARLSIRLSPEVRRLLKQVHEIGYTNINRRRGYLLACYDESFWRVVDLYVADYLNFGKDIVYTFTQQSVEDICDEVIEELYPVGHTTYNVSALARQLPNGAILGTIFEGFLDDSANGNGCNYESTRYKRTGNSIWLSWKYAQNTGRGTTRRRVESR